MKFRITRIVVAVFVAAISAPMALAQQSPSGPSEYPPVGYSGKQFVDSAGCVFTRAGVDDAVLWMPRVQRDRAQICGRTPTFPDAAPSAITRTAEGNVLIGPLAPASAEPSQGGGKRTVAKAQKSPERRPAQDTTSVAGLIVTPSSAAASGVTGQTRVLPRHVYDARQVKKKFRIPAGYRAAWTDDRLNPRRAEQTLDGRAQMLNEWSEDVPMQSDER